MMAATKNDMVSIVIPAYNAERYLEETVASALASTYPFLEVIIVNDGSTDGTQRVIESLASRHPQVRGFYQRNQGASAARNLAVGQALGTFLLPVDADDLISSDYVATAVEILKRSDRIKVVYGQAEFIGDKTGKWKLPPFDRHLLARKNMLYVSGVFRRADFDKVGGYCEDIVGREDWDFWISLLKRDGEVVRIPSVCFYYRIHVNSKRRATRNRKRELIDILNERHKAFFHRELGGRLHYMRTWSRFLNALGHLFHPERVFCSPSCQDLEEFVYTSPERFDDEPVPSASGASNSRVFEVCGSPVAVTRYDEPTFIRQLLGDGYPESQARRSFHDAERQFLAGTTRAEPVGYYEKRAAFWCSRSFYVSVQRRSP
jgi:glycosyltransferase involved in cell wall biosynthesis